MAIPILNHMDFQKTSELRNALLHVTADSGVSSPGTGQIIYDSGVVKFYNGSAWITLSSTGGTMSSFVLSDGTNTQTITDGNTLIVEAGEGINSVVGATDKVTISAELSTASNKGVVIVAEGEGINVTYDTGTATVAAEDATTTNKGIASFSTDNFAVNSGAITIKDLGVAAAEIAADAVVTAKILNANVTTAKLADDNVTYAKIQNVAANNVLLGNNGGAGTAVQELSKANVLTLLNVADGAQVNVNTNLSQTTAVGQLTISSSTGDDIVVAEASATIAGVMSVTHHDKLDGIEASADVTDTANVKTALGAAMPSNALAIGDANTVTTIAGNLVVSGTQTIQNETIQVVEDNTILFEGATADLHETKLTVVDPTADRIITLPDATGTVALTTDVTSLSDKITKKLSGDASATAFTIIHGFGTPHVAVEVLDYGNDGTGATYAQCIVDIVKGADNNKIVITFSAAPSASQDYLVLVSKFPAIT